jgi:hypothetical protein
LLDRRSGNALDNIRISTIMSRRVALSTIAETAMPEGRPRGAVPCAAIAAAVRRGVTGAKKAADPQALMNPGVLIAP